MGTSSSELTNMKDYSRAFDDARSLLQRLDDAGRTSTEGKDWTFMENTKVQVSAAWRLFFRLSELTCRYTRQSALVRAGNRPFCSDVLRVDRQISRVGWLVHLAYNTRCDPMGEAFAVSCLGKCKYWAKADSFCFGS
jgi:hypothetical protein